MTMARRVSGHNAPHHWPHSEALNGVLAALLTAIFVVLAGVVGWSLLQTSLH